MRLTQAQLRSLVGITEETFRTWRKTFPNLCRGKSTPFTLGETLALALVHDFVRNLGVKVGQLAAIGPELFDACETAARDETDELIVLHEDGIVTCSASATMTDITPPAVVLSLRATLERLRADMVEQHPQPSDQIGLPFLAENGPF